MPTTPPQQRSDRSEMLDEATGEEGRSSSTKPNSQTLPIYPGQMRATGASTAEVRSGGFVLLQRGQVRFLRTRRWLLWFAGLSYPLYLIADRIAHILGFCLGI